MRWVTRDIRLCPVVKQIFSDGLGVLDITKEVGMLLHARYAERAALSLSQWQPFSFPAIVSKKSDTESEKIAPKDE